MGKLREFDFLDPQKRVIVIYDRMFPLYLVLGEKTYLIDTGTTARSQSHLKRIRSVLQTIEPDGDRTVDTLLLTHSHWDHVGGAHELQKELGFNILASNTAVEVLQKPKAVSFINRLNQDYIRMLPEAEASPGEFSYLGCLGPLEAGSRVPVSKDSFLEVFETPGHTRCSLSFLLYPQKILFCGDASGVIEADRSIKPLFLSSYLESITSLNLLLDLDAEMIAFPHNMVIRGKGAVRAHLERSIERFDWLKNRIVQLLDKMDDSAAIARELLYNEFSKPTLMGPEEAQLINLEAMVGVVEKEIIRSA